MPDSFMVSGVFGMFFIHRKRTASLPLSETAPFFLLSRNGFVAHCQGIPFGDRSRLCPRVAVLSSGFAGMLANR